MNRHGTFQVGGLPVRENHALMVVRHRGLTILLRSCTLIAMLGVSAARADSSSATPIEPAGANARSGPVELTVTLCRGTAQIAEPVTLTLSARAADPA